MNGIADPTWKDLGDAIHAQENPYELVWHTMYFGPISRTFGILPRVQVLANCPVCYTAYPSGARCIECNHDPDDDAVMARRLYFGHDDALPYQLVLAGQVQGKPKLLSQLMGKIPYADLNDDRFVYQEKYDPLHADVHHYMGELSRANLLSRLAPRLYDLLKEATEARAESINWSINYLLYTAPQLISQDDYSAIMSHIWLRNTRLTEERVDQSIQPGVAPTHNEATLPPYPPGQPPADDPSDEEAW